MKPVAPKHFYITDWALADPVCKARMERMMDGFGVSVDAVEVLTEDDIEPMIREKDWVDLDIRQGRMRFDGDPDVVFNKYRWHAPQDAESITERHAIIKDATRYTRQFIRVLYGLPDFYHYEDGNSKRNAGVTCWSLYDLHSALGCFHKCQYCRRGRVTTLALNIEEFVEHVDGLMDENPWQTVYRYDVETDCLILEPEYGMCRELVEHYAELDDKYIILFSKSDNVEFLLDLEHKGHTIMLWTLSTPTVSREIEVATATMEERLEAARKCQEAGYTVRFKMKPIIPIADWRAEATEMFEKLFDTVQPDNLSMEMLFFDTVDELKELFDISLFDPALIQRLEEHEASGQMTDRSHPIPADIRAEVYEHYLTEIKRLSPETPISLCAETSEMWERLGPKLGMTKESFVCNCGPVCTPGLQAHQIMHDGDGKAVVVG